MTRVGFMLAVTTACSRPELPAPTPPAAPDPAIVTTAIESISQHYKAYILNGDALGIASLFTPEGQLSSEGLPVLTGKRVIAEGLQGAFSSVRYTGWDLTIRRMVPLGLDSARAEGTLHELTLAKGKELHRWSRWEALYLMEPDGYYRIQRFVTRQDSVK